jgi:hypothetical protein
VGGISDRCGFATLCVRVVLGSSVFISVNRQATFTQSTPEMGITEKTCL